MTRSRLRMLAAGLGAVVVGLLLARAMAGRGADFVDALHMAPLATLAVVTLLQGVALVARSEAWSVCISAAGGSVARRRLYRAASMGYAGNLLNGQFGDALHLLDRVLWDRMAARLRANRARTNRLAAHRWEAALRALSVAERRAVETAYFGGLGIPEVRRLVWPTAAA